MIRELLSPRVFLQVSQKPKAEDLAVESFLAEDALQRIDINSDEVFKGIQAKISDGDLIHLFGHEE
jgi:hypothetical protein